MSEKLTPLFLATGAARDVRIDNVAADTITVDPLEPNHTTLFLCDDTTVRFNDQDVTLDKFGRTDAFDTEGKVHQIDFEINIQS